MIDDPTTPLERPDFDLVARVRRIDSKVYVMNLWRVQRAKDGAQDSLGLLVFRSDEWAQIVPGLRARGVIIDYVAEMEA